MNEAFHFLSSHEPVFKQIVAEYGLPIIPVRPQGFETLVLLILEQQVSIDSAKATFLRLKTKVNIIQPETLVKLTVEDFRIVGVSRQKASYLVGLSKTIMNKDLSLDGLSRKTVGAVRDELIKIKGIGHWTIDVYLMFSLQAPDILPIGDVAVQTTIKRIVWYSQQRRNAFVFGEMESVPFLRHFFVMASLFKEKKQKDLLQLLEE